MQEATNETKAGRGQFKCFHCRQIFANKEGNWFDWEQMQVHLCRGCDQQTAKKPQRARGGRSFH